MKKYVIALPVIVNICVDADDEDKALDAANREIRSKLQGCTFTVDDTGKVIAEI